MKRYDIERAVERADLPGPSVGILGALCRRMNAREGAIPRRYQPSLTELARATGYDRSTVMRHLKALDRAGWVVRDSPARADAARYHLTTAYELCIPQDYPQARGAAHTGPGAETTGARGSELHGPGAERLEARGAPPHKTEEKTEEKTSSPGGDGESELVDIAAAELGVLTGRRVSPDDAAVAVWLVLEGRTVRDRGAYLRKALRADPGRYLPKPAGPPPFRQLRAEGKA